MSNSFDDMPFFDEEPNEPRRPAPNAAPAAGGLGIAARAMAARDQARGTPIISPASIRSSGRRSKRWMVQCWF